MNPLTRLKALSLGGSIAASCCALAEPAAAQVAPRPAQQAPLGQQTPPASDRAPDRWVVGDAQIAFLPARVAFPRTAGAIAAVHQEELSAEGQGIDNAVQYRSADGQIIGTVYVYQPGLPHAGLAALITDETIRGTSDVPVDGGAIRIAGAGGERSVAIRSDYRNYQGRYASDAAFIKAGRWLVKLRVSGPTSRAGEVDAAMESLLAGILWGANPPWPAAPVTVTPCASGTGMRDARPLPDPPGAEIAAHAFLGTFDGGGIAATEDGARRDLPSRIPPELCLSSYLDPERRRMQILRGPAGEPRSIDGRTRLVALLGDNGMALEVVHARNLGRYVILMHRMGETHLLGGYDDVPSDRQVADILYGRDQPGARPRATVRFPAERGPELHILTPFPGAPARPDTAPAAPSG